MYIMCCSLQIYQFMFKSQCWFRPLYKAIDRLENKSSSGHDGISNKLLKLVKNELKKLLTLIVNQMITTGIFPEAFKISKITPLYKKGDHSLLANYRPISLLPTISKVFERIIYDQMYEYLNENNLLAKEQFGFRKNHSTECSYKFG